MKRNRLLGDIGRHSVLGIVVVLMFVPTLLMLVIAVKDNNQYATNPYGLTFPFHWENYATALRVLWRSLLNSVLLSGVTAILVTLVGAMSAYVFARFEFPGKRVAFYAFIGLIMIPSVLTLIPQFEVVRDLGLLDSWWALVLPWVAVGQVTAIFLIRAFFESLPSEVFEAARLDGAGEVRVFLRIAVPMSKPILSVVALFNVLGTWNDVIWPLVTLNDKGLFPLALGLMRFRDSYYTAWGPLMAGYALAAVPLLLLFIFANRSFIDGAVAMKGKI